MKVPSYERKWALAQDLVGHKAGLSLPSSNVGDLKALAQKSLEKQFLRLTTAEGRILNDPFEPLEDAGLKDGDQLAAIVGQAKLAATESAFALWCHRGDGVATWGPLLFGGNSSEVQDQLRIVQHVQSTNIAFAAILEGGSIVTWGHPYAGGDSSKVQEQLRNVQQVQATYYAFAAILEDGSVVTWGNPLTGGDSSGVRDQLRSVLAGSGHRSCICCHPARWLRCCLGQFGSWWRQFCSPRPAGRCAAASGHRRSICCDPGRWLGGDMG